MYDFPLSAAAIFLVLDKKGLLVLDKKGQIGGLVSEALHVHHVCTKFGPFQP